MRPEEYLTDFTPPPIDEEEIREALAAALKARAPPALIRLVGRQAYSRCAGAPRCLMACGGSTTAACGPCGQASTAGAPTSTLVLWHHLKPIRRPHHIEEH